MTDGFLAGLASSDSDDGRPSPAGPPVVPAPPEADQAPIPLFELPDDEDEGPPASPVPATRHRSSIPARTWVVTCALLGLTLVLFIIGVDQLIRAISSVPEEPIARSPEPERPPAPAIAVDAAPIRPIPPPKRRAGDSSGHAPGGLDRAG